MSVVDVCRSSTTACFESILALPSAYPAARRSWLSPRMVGEQQQELNERTKNSLLPQPQVVEEEEEEHVKRDDGQGELERPPWQFDIWSSIQAQKAQQQQEAQRKEAEEEPYVHPLMRRSSSLLSQKGLEICTESLGSETGSDDFFSSDDEADFFSLRMLRTKETEQKQELYQSENLIDDDDDDDDDDDEEEEEEEEGVKRSGWGIRKELATVNYHCSISRRSSQPRSFPPPLPSISRRDGPCLQMRPHRRDGRLVVEAVTVPSQNYLHANRQNGRLLLSFINTTSSRSPCAATESATTNAADNAATETELTEEFQQTRDTGDQQEEAVEVEEEEQATEEEVEVVDRGTVVEVKVSTQPQHTGGGAASASTMKVHRSSIVINKFVSCMPISNTQEKPNAISAAAAAAAEEEEEAAPPLSPVRRLATTSTTTAAAAAVAASSLSAQSAADGSHGSTNDNRLLFASRRRNREELLHDMRRCSQLRKPLFIWEPCCIATSS